MEESYDKNHLVVLMGKLKFDLLSLEFLLRFYLLKKELKEIEIENIEKLKVGDRIKVNSFTNYDNLRELIDKYNKIIDNSKLKLDEKIVIIRDVISHGRLFEKETKEGKNPFTIFKFTKPEKQKNFVNVIYKEYFDIKWLLGNSSLVYEATIKVRQATEEKQMGSTIIL